MDKRAIPDTVPGIINVLHNISAAYNVTGDDVILGPIIRSYVGELLERAVKLNNKVDLLK